MTDNTYLAVDFGGGSGRVMAGTLKNGILSMEEVHRFGNRQVTLGKHVYWDFPALFADMKEGLRKAGERYEHVVGIGIDTWGVDFGLISRDGNLLSLPICYRDARTEGAPERLFAQSPLTPQSLYAHTGTQQMAINTIFQLHSLYTQGDSAGTKEATNLLFMPDLFSYYLTGVANNEYTIASTSGLLDAKNKNWNKEWIKDNLSFLSPNLLGEVVMPGTVRGPLLPKLAEELHLPNAKVIAVGSHDTASAVIAAPIGAKRAAWLSSGTWSLLGTSIDEPILTEDARKAEFTNEGGADGRICFLRNITGLWLLQQLTQEWEKQGKNADYTTLINEAETAQSTSIISVDDECFQNPQSMEQAIRDYCKAKHSPIPQTRGEMVRCILMSLANTYSEAIAQLNHLLPQPIECIHIFGGGSKNRLLNQFTADITGLPVIAGPAEATAIGNILIQAKSHGDIISMDELHNVVINSVDTHIFKPNN